MNTIASILVVLGLSATACLPLAVKRDDADLHPEHAVNLVLGGFEHHPCEAGASRTEPDAP